MARDKRTQTDGSQVNLASSPRSGGGSIPIEKSLTDSILKTFVERIEPTLLAEHDFESGAYDGCRGDTCVGSQCGAP
jgi:hypothetical protein